MPKKPNQKLKMLYLKKIMLELTDEQHGLTIANIIDKLMFYGIEAERKSLYDDFEALKLFGIDIEKRKANGTVEYYVAGRDFELPELKLLVDAVQSSKFITRKKSDELIKKIEGLSSVYEAGELQRQVFVANRIKTMNESIYYTVDYIHTAILNDLQISFKYFEWNYKKEKIFRHNEKTYTVSPFALTWDDENYYLIAFDGESQIIKHYRVDKMLKLEVINKKREGKNLFKSFDMAIYSKQTFGMYGGNEEKVKLRCKNSMAGIIIDRFGQDVSLIPDGDEHFTVWVKVVVSPLFLTWLMNFGENVKILSPKNVTEQFIKTAEEAVKQYK